MRWLNDLFAESQLEETQSNLDEAKAKLLSLMDEKSGGQAGSQSGHSAGG